MSSCEFSRFRATSVILGATIAYLGVKLESELME